MKQEQNICPFCNDELAGIEGKKVCSNINCRAYQVNEQNYDKSLSKREYEERLKK